MRSRGLLLACLENALKVFTLYLTGKTKLEERFTSVRIRNVEEICFVRVSLDILSMCGTRTCPSEFFMLGMQNPGA